jgi:Leucine-rich repeat (LRR) protein
LNNWITLKYLYLSNNYISDLGAVILAGTFLLNNATLKQLHLGSNWITDYGIKHLAEVLKTNKTLTDLFSFS